jgi:hypothetical protein
MVTYPLDIPPHGHISVGYPLDPNHQACLNGLAAGDRANAAWGRAVASKEREEVSGLLIDSIDSLEEVSGAIHNRLNRLVILTCLFPLSAFVQHVRWISVGS